MNMDWQVAEVFNKLAPFLKMYTTFVDKYNPALDRIDVSVRYSGCMHVSVYVAGKHTRGYWWGACTWMSVMLGSCPPT